jgi:hypothetical protein
MKSFCQWLRQVTLGLGAAVELLAVLTTFAIGCSEKTVKDKTPEEIEKSRQEHIQTMRREAGESAAAGKTAPSP